jgi:proteic killer suppression protein
VISSFKDEEAKLVFDGFQSKKLPSDIQNTARRKLKIIDAARDLRDLAAPPGNRLKPLKGKRRGQHAIRINDQWRICFKWKDGNAEAVEIEDYHD